MNKEFFTGKTVLVMGLGRFGGGVDVAKFAHNAGANVIVTDLAPSEQLSDSIRQLDEFPDIDFHLGSHDPSDFEQADIIVANPAVPPDNEFLDIARSSNKLITSQISIFFELCPVPIVGITGANGKSTTAALTAHLLKATMQEKRGTRDERKQKTENRSQVSSIETIWLSGNIGDRPLLAAVDQISPNDLVVLELSSFQLEQLAQIKKAPKIALLTNLTPNHLDRHGTFASYCAAKENIFKFQKLNENSPAVSVFNADDKIGTEWFDKYNSDHGRICIKFSPDDLTQEIHDGFTLPGRANLSNLAAAVAVARHFGVPDDLIGNSLPHFKALPHRLELIGQINGVRWYNDSIATTPQSAIAALEAFDRPRIIIAGGYDKDLPFEALGQKIAGTAKAAILLGQTARKIADAIRAADVSLRGPRGRSNLKPHDRRHAIRDTNIVFAETLAEAVQLAARLADAGDVVLLSPACASYDMFDNFQQRGREFLKLVRDISPT
ncbi:MAG: UDP-N-acetylmuramoyl-L-alanine--D-glutamate ligase [Planctomycetes bacterium]|nr:UDP-N-acetylmuramoyl-L-alanine--D-glutamate ligase [Planctomycetota bacterium]